MITSYQTFKYYFATLAMKHPSVKTFTMYDPDRKLHDQRAQEGYPIFELERPSFSGNATDDGVHLKSYQVRFSLLDTVTQDDWLRQEQILDAMEKVMDDMITIMNQDEVLQNDTFNVYPIRNAENDNLWGWGIEFTYTPEVSFCPTSLPTLETVIRLQPTFSSGQTDLVITVDGIPFSEPWAAETDSLSGALTHLAKQITDHASTTTKAIENFGTLVLYGAAPGYSLGIVGHGFTEVS